MPNPSLKSKTTQAVPAQPQAIRILIVDDDPDYLGLLNRHFGQLEGVDIDVATGPQMAVHMLTCKTYDLVVSDWALDSTTAPEVFCEADTLIAESRRVPLMLISGSEKVSKMQLLESLEHFQPVSFLLKSYGPPLIRLLAEHILRDSQCKPGVRPC